MILLFANDCLLSRSCLFEDPSVVCHSSPYQGDLAQKKMVVHLFLVAKKQLSQQGSTFRLMLFHLELTQDRVLQPRMT